MSAKKPDGDADALPPTPLADLARVARERLGQEPDRAGPAATRAMAAVVRDLKGMPEILVTRDGTHAITIARRGKIGGLTIEYRPAIRAIEITYGDFSVDPDPLAKKLHRYTFSPGDGPHGAWRRLDEASELFADVRATLLRLYPELADVR